MNTFVLEEMKALFVSERTKIPFLERKRHYVIIGLEPCPMRAINRVLEIADSPSVLRKKQTEPGCQQTMRLIDCL